MWIIIRNMDRIFKNKIVVKIIEMFRVKIYIDWSKKIRLNVLFNRNKKDGKN